MVRGLQGKGSVSRGGPEGNEAVQPIFFLPFISDFLWLVALFDLSVLNVG